MPDFRLLKSNLESFLEVLKARATKYIKKIPTGNHKRPFRYLYTQAQVKEYEKEVAEKKQRTRKQSEKKPKKVTKEKPSEPKTKETVIDPITDYKVNKTKAKAFKEWFGDWEKAKQTGNYDGVSKVIDSETGEPKEMSSKIVDNEGNPIPVYHGTKSVFDEFKLSEFGKTDSGWFGEGFYFTESKDDAKSYSLVPHLQGTNTLDSLKKDLDTYIYEVNESTLIIATDNQISINQIGLDEYSEQEFSLDTALEYIDKLRDNVDTLKYSLEDIYEFHDYRQDQVRPMVERQISEMYRTLNILEAKIFIMQGKAKKEDYLKKTYLNIKNPLYIDGNADPKSIKYNKALIKKLGNKELIDISNKETENVFQKFGAKKLTNLLKSKGYDGVIVFGDRTMGSKFHEVVAFEPNQIKHVDNQGTFDPNENNIYKSMQKLNLLKAQLAQRMK